jgi:hypothetical protein
MKHLPRFEDEQKEEGGGLWNCQTSVVAYYIGTVGRVQDLGGAWTEAWIVDCAKASYDCG